MQTRPFNGRPCSLLYSVLRGWFTLYQGPIMSLLDFFSQDLLLLSQCRPVPSKRSVAGTATYMICMRGGVGGALSDGRPYPYRLFLPVCKSDLTFQGDTNIEYPFVFWMICRIVMV